MKKFLSCVLSIIVVSVVLITPLDVNAYFRDAFMYNRLDDETIEIVYYKGAKKILNIPSTLDGYTVVRISGGACYDNGLITEVTIPDTVVSIGVAAFDSCKFLEKVTMSNSVSCISENLFYDCDSLSEIVIPDSVTRIDAGAFYACDNLKELTIPDSVTYIGDKVFYGCSNLKKISVYNPDCIMEDSSVRPEAVIYGYEKSTAQIYAELHGNEFVSLGLLPIATQYGDINKDKYIDVKDVTALQMHLANYNVEVDETQLDINDDGIVDVNDVTTLQLFLISPNQVNVTGLYAAE